MDNIEKVAENLENSIGNSGKVIKGWVTKIKDFSQPIISLTTYDNWPNHADINIWLESKSIRDEITETVLQTLNRMSELVSIKNVMPISFEEEGVLQPGSWNIIENSKPLFRQLIQISY